MTSHYVTYDVIFTPQIIRKIQRNWRQTRATCDSRFPKRFTENRYSYHVYLLMENLDRKARAMLSRAAIPMQKLVRFYLVGARERKIQRRVDALWSIRRYHY